jgi:hypothetical protein
MGGGQSRQLNEFACVHSVWFRVVPIELEFSGENGGRNDASILRTPHHAKPMPQAADDLTESRCPAVNRCIKRGCAFHLIVATGPELASMLRLGNGLAATTHRAAEAGRRPQLKRIPDRRANMTIRINIYQGLTCDESREQ